ncbi:MAG: DUF4199 domain-containing protein [Bacteroidota bacterium]|nr:DUF4199 domain-containing protein [Bacteroidota bacterium]
MENFNNNQTNQQIQNTSLAKNSSIYGGIAGGITTFVILISYISNFLVNHQIIVNIVTNIILIVCIIIGTMNYRNKILGGYISYGKALVNGTLIGFFNSIISIFVLFTLYKIDPNLIERLLDKSRELMESFNKLSDEEIDNIIDQSRDSMHSNLYYIKGLISSTIGAFIISLITSAFLKKRDKSYDSNFKDVM